MRNPRNFLILCVGSLISILWMTSLPAQAQDGGWSEPYRLSSEAGKSSEGYLVSDQYGYVHAFWVETLFEDQKTIIQYSRFDGETWTNPNDIIIPTGAIENISPAVDQQGTLHIIWTKGVSGPVYYSRAPANNAQSASSWSTPMQLDITGGIVRLRIDSSGTFHVVYINRGTELGVYYTRSEDQGANWSEPRWLDPDIPLNYTPASLNFELDENDGLHVVWSYGALVVNTPDVGWVRYIHSLDGGDTWAFPFTIDKDIEGMDSVVDFAEPRMIVQGQTVHVVWAAGSFPYRNHRFSNDRGDTWNPPEQIFGELHGQAFDGLVVDGAGRVHFFGQIRYPMGIYHAVWDQTRWTPPILIFLVSGDRSLEGIGDNIHAHYTIPAVRAGNQLVLTFTDGPADPNRRLFAMVHTLDDILPLEPLPTTVRTETSRPESSPTPISPTLMPTWTAIPPFIDTAAKPMERALRPDQFLWITLVANLLIFGATISYRLFYKNKFWKPGNK